MDYKRFGRYVHKWDPVARYTVHNLTILLDGLVVAKL
jgi:hypothetical protein